MKLTLAFVFGFLLSTTLANLTPEQKKRCEQYTSIFENDTTELQYEYCENINDGRGYTSGRAGFCTGTGDALLVIKTYTAYVPDNPLAKFLPELERLAKKWSGETKNLPGYCDAWYEAASKDFLFLQVQDAISDQLYYGPSMLEAQRVGLTTALGKCSFYDTIIQHGGGTDSNSFYSLVKKTETAMNGTIMNDGGVGKSNENQWVSQFLQQRHKNLQWRLSTDRVDAMIQLANQSNWNMEPPMRIKTRHHDLTIQS